MTGAPGDLCYAGDRDDLLAVKEIIDAFPASSQHSQYWQMAHIDTVSGDLLIIYKRPGSISFTLPNGLEHRCDGPAFIILDTSGNDNHGCAYFLDGISYSKEEHTRRVRLRIFG